MQNVTEGPVVSEMFSCCLQSTDKVTFKQSQEVPLFTFFALFLTLFQEILHKQEVKGKLVLFLLSLEDFDVLCSIHINTTLFFIEFLFSFSIVITTLIFYVHICYFLIGVI